MRLTDNLRGALLMMGTMAAFTVNDAFMKAAAAELPVMQAIFWRGAMVVPVMLILCRALGQLRFNISARDWRLVLIRSAAEMLGAVMFMTALFNMPFANVSAILQALPLSVSLAAALFFAEPLGWRRLTAILIGFCGVLLIIQPGGADFNYYSLFAVGCVLAVTVRDLAARQMSKNVPSTFAGLIAAIGVMALAGAGAVFEDPVPLTWTLTAQLFCATVFIVIAYVISVTAMRVGEISFVAPFRYTSLLVAMLLGAVVFGEIPSTTTMIGASIVVATGLFTLYREQVVARRQSSIR